MRMTPRISGIMIPKNSRYDHYTCYVNSIMYKWNSKNRTVITRNIVVGIRQDLRGSIKLPDTRKRCCLSTTTTATTIKPSSMLPQTASPSSDSQLPLASSTTDSSLSLSSSSNSNSDSSIFRRYPISMTLITMFVGITGYSINYMYHHVSGGTLEGLQRSIQFYSFGIPKYFLYRYYMWRYPNHDNDKDNNDNNQVWDQLHTLTSQQGLQLIVQLKGFYIKCGQLCASNIGNSFPPIWQDTMSVLQDQCPSLDYTTIEHIIKEEYNIANIHDMFEYIEPIPIGAASIGQVHRALLKVPSTYNEENDEISTTTTTTTTTHSTTTTTTTTKTIPVVLKICYPYAERLLRGDVATMKAFAQIVQPVHVPGIIEMEKQFATEFDYRIEGQHLQQVRTNLIQAGLCGCNKNITKRRNNKYRYLPNHSILCTIPKPYLSYCTKRILVMEELKGDKLVVALRQNAAKLAKFAGYDNVEEFIQQQSKQHPTTNHPTTVLSSNEYERIQFLYHLSSIYSNMKYVLYNWTIGWFVRKKESFSSSSSTITTSDDNDWPLLNHAKLIDDLIYIHGHEVLVDGIFNRYVNSKSFFYLRMGWLTIDRIQFVSFGCIKKSHHEKK
jgi:ABC1 atypical kinase-like domain